MAAQGVWPDACSMSIEEFSAPGALDLAKKCLNNNIPLFVFSFYDRQLFSAMGSFFTKNDAEWILCFRFLDDLFYIHFRKAESPCFDCLPPLTMFERVVDTIVVSANAPLLASARATISAFLLRELSQNCLPESKSHKSVLRLNPRDGVVTNIRRLWAPSCATCASRLHP